MADLVISILNATNRLLEKNLGTHYDKDYLLQLLEENKKHLSQKNVEHEAMPDSNFSNKTGILSTNKETLPEPFIFIKTDLRLVIDLQQCVKAQQNQSYARRVKLTNLQEMAKTDHIKKQSV